MASDTASSVRVGSDQLVERLAAGLDRASPVPLYYQLAQTIQGLINSGGLTAGSRLWNEADLARELGISRPTVRRALGYLADGGLVLRMRGMGTVVMPVPIRRSVALTSVYDDLAESGHRPATRVLALATVNAPATVAATLGLPDGSKALYLRRLRLADGEPLAVMENFLPPGLLRLERDQLEQTGLYRLMRSAGIVPRVASQTISARLATTEESYALGLDEGVPILQLERVSFDETGRAIEHASHAYVAARHSFQMNLISDIRAASP